MTSEAIIKADKVIPWDGTETTLPALSIEISDEGTSCLLGEDSQLLADYLRALCGVDDIFSGRLELFGSALETMNRHDWLQMRPQVGFVARTAPLLSVLNGIENVVLPALYHKTLSRNDAEATAQRLLEKLGCEADLSLLPAYLSPLERTQLAIARAAIMDPPVLFLEEPFHGLEINEHNIINPFLREWAENRALVISTRNLHFVKQQADQIIFADQTKILYFDSWDAFCSTDDPAARNYLQQYRENYSI